ncbi:(d)CMP kinase [Acidaminobacter hydrogenoformans]|uniref:Cytidylate kinase n=1 Tax=Acidaminobacter hydrogenoformans DSM 2784 TaxID=1120920 RepID=A0A1G5RSI3_9FIRM|nr:(d)CMP kinase [Acidaminobacter hydrogenoformans]SCZ76770.1 cytidylate kinase [Acidaminobacter hydrogenoformans DSM 2784]
MEAESKRRIQIALDGPAGSGKSTVARRVAKALGCDYIDTGAMYRAIALKFIETGLFQKLDAAASSLTPALEAEIDHLLDTSQLELFTEKVILDGRDVSEAIRTQEVTRRVSQVAAMSPVRRHLVKMQRGQAQGRSVVMDGRDIGTVVLPETPYKFFLTASLEERARRRFLEFEAKGFEADFETILKDIEHRDKVDSSREDSPLVMAADAVRIDTTGKTIDQVVTAICEAVEALKMSAVKTDSVDKSTDAAEEGGKPGC